MITTFAAVDTQLYSREEKRRMKTRRDAGRQEREAPDW